MSFNTNTYNTLDFSSGDVDTSRLVVDFSVSYTISNFVNQGININYKIEERVAVDLEIEYTSDGYIYSDLNVVYTIEQQITSNLEVVWGVESNLTPKVSNNKICIKPDANLVSICY
jgi:hypothetical protein